MDGMKKKKHNKGMKMITVRDVPDDLHKRLKLLCVENGISINAQIIKLINDCVEYAEGERQEKKPK